MRPEKVEKFSAIVLSNGNVRYFFHIPCKVKYSEIGGKGINVLTIDHSMFTAFEILKEKNSASNADKINYKIDYGMFDYTETVICKVTVKQ